MRNVSDEASDVRDVFTLMCYPKQQNTDTNIKCRDTKEQSKHTIHL